VSRTHPAFARAAVRELVTPEGVPLDLTLATVSERFTAFAIDGMILLGALVALVLFYVFGPVHEDWFDASTQLGMFVLLNGYFIWFELRWAGRTPGKKAMGIRVASRSGGPLRADAVIARNLMRDVELFLPLKLLFHRAELTELLSPAAWWLLPGWVLALALVPLFNRDHLRVGDLVGGTWVVRSPKASLSLDLARAATTTFTTAQLEVYGIYELQALEDVLRSGNPGAPELRKAVAKKIAKKIAHEGDTVRHADRFLSDFYAALRAHLERRMLFGERKEKKDR
jgi:uncharacterized RDD family membrane protein YckC